MTISDKIKLNNGIDMPMFGLGVYAINSGKETQNAVRYALDAGYRLIDTASMYNNEEDVGIAVRESKIPREEIFVTTKLWDNDHEYQKVFIAFDKSLRKLNIEYIDLYLIHWPAYSERGETWKAFEKILESGKCKAIGISNYTTNHIKELLPHANVIPSVNQVEFNTFSYKKSLLEFCRSKNIQLEAYSPLLRGRKFNDPALTELAKKYSKSPVQIMIRWVLQKHVIAIPKSANKKRIEENADVFDFNISNEDMQHLDSLSYNFGVV